MMLSDNAAMALSAIGTFMLALLIAVFGLTVRATRRWTRVEANIEAMQQAFSDHVATDRMAHEAMWQEMKEDRRATNERLTFLERREMER